MLISAGELQVDGVLRSQGEQRSIPNGATDASGAGGSILVTAGTLSGTGTIEASGGDYNDLSFYGGSGGGGRIALLVDTLNGFDPATQAKAWGGESVKISKVSEKCAWKTLAFECTTYARACK